MNYLKYVLSIGIILLPLFYWEVPKVWAYIAFISIFSIYVLYLSINEKLFLSIQKSKLKTTLFLFLIIAAVSSLLGPDVNKSIVGNYYRFDGLVVLFQLVGFSIVFGSVYKVEWKKIISFAIFLSAVISSLWNNFGQINFLVGFVLTSLPFGLYLFKTEKNKYFKVAILVGFLLLFRVPVIASSYIGLMGLMILFPVWLILQNKKYLKFLIIPIICTIITFVYLWFRDLSKNTEYVAESRIRIYRNIFVGTLKRPLLGYGWSNTDNAFASVVWPMKFNNDIYVDKAHMLILDIFANTGIVGLTVFIIVLYFTFKKLTSKSTVWNRTLTLSLIMHLLYSQTNVTSISEEFIFWMIIGTLL